MRKLIAISLTLLLWPFGAASAAEEIFQWKEVGGDPCNEQAGCTLSWALEQAEAHGWPHEVTEALARQVAEDEPQKLIVRSGWAGWMTFGQHTPRFEPETAADWPSDQREAALQWSKEHRGRQYNLILVEACQNWGGWTAVLINPPESRVTLRCYNVPTGNVVRSNLPNGFMTFGRADSCCCSNDPSFGLGGSVGPDSSLRSSGYARKCELVVVPNSP